MCHLWPAIAPHGAEVPTSVWNLPYSTWLILAGEADAWKAAQEKAAG